MFLEVWSQASWHLLYMTPGKNWPVSTELLHSKIWYAFFIFEDNELFGYKEFIMILKNIWSQVYRSFIYTYKNQQNQFLARPKTAVLDYVCTVFVI